MFKSNIITTHTHCFFLRYIYTHIEIASRTNTYLNLHIKIHTHPHKCERTHLHTHARTLRDSEKLWKRKGERQRKIVLSPLSPLYSLHVYVYILVHHSHLYTCIHTHFLHTHTLDQTHCHKKAQILIHERDTLNNKHSISHEDISKLSLCFTICNFHKLSFTHTQ